ncbi:MAG: TetR/AcrR family transcriptional regulator [Dysgonomonas sp.]
MPKIQTDKQTLIRKSMLVFIKHGYYRTSLSELAKACNVEKPHFYYYFKDKKDIMNEVLTYASSQIEKLVFSIAFDNEKEPVVRLNTLLDNVLEIHTKNEYGCLMGNTILETAGREALFKDVLCNYFDKWKEMLVHLYITKYETDTATEMAYEDISKIQGSIMLMRLYRDKEIFWKAVGEIKKRL